MAEKVASKSATLMPPPAAGALAAADAGADAAVVGTARVGAVVATGDGVAELLHAEATIAATAIVPMSLVDSRI
jgi:hypothetical protein